MRRGDFLIRTLQAGADGRCVVEGVGYGVEVLDGGRFQHQNFLSFGRADSGELASFVGDNVLLCRDGARTVAEFDRLTLVTPSTAILDAVTVRIQTCPTAAFVDTDPVGKDRVRWLARSEGPETVAATAAVVLASINDAAPQDDFVSGEFHKLCWFHGWIGSTNRFITHVVTRATPLDVSNRYIEVERLNARDHTPSLAFPGVFWSQTWACDFTMGPAPHSFPVQVPFGECHVVFRNTHLMGLDEQIEYAIGIRG